MVSLFSDAQWWIASDALNDKFWKQFLTFLTVKCCLFIPWLWFAGLFLVAINHNKTSHTTRQKSNLQKPTWCKQKNWCWRSLTFCFLQFLNSGMYRRGQVALKIAGICKRLLTRMTDKLWSLLTVNVFINLRAFKLLFFENSRSHSGNCVFCGTWSCTRAYARGVWG